MFRKPYFLREDTQAWLCFHIQILFLTMKPVTPHPLSTSGVGNVIEVDSIDDGLIPHPPSASSARNIIEVDSTDDDLLLHPQPQSDLGRPAAAERADRISETLSVLEKHTCLAEALKAEMNHQLALCAQESEDDDNDDEDAINTM